MQESVNDIIKSYGNDNSFQHVLIRREGGLISGDNRLTVPGSNSYHTVYNNVPSYTGWSPDVTLPAAESVTTARLLAQTGPLTAQVNLPLFIYELKDIPMMLRHAGNLLHKIRRPSGLKVDKEIAAATLAYQFGWKPLIEDLGKLLDFANRVRRTQENIRKAGQPSGLRRRIPLDETSSAKTVTRSLMTSPVTVTRPCLDVLHRRRWASVRWAAKSGQNVGRDPSWTESVRIALGFQTGYIPITVWKAIPWTWMIDWFTDISNVLIANHNLLHYTCKSCCVMTETRGSVSCEGYTGKYGLGTISCTGVKNTELRQLRVASSIGVQLPTLRLPFLDNFKLSVLGSLAILRLRK